MTTAVPPPQVSADRTTDGLLASPWLFPAALTFAHLPLLLQHFANLWSRSHYQYFPVALFAIGYLLTTRAVRQSHVVSRRQRWLSWGMLGISVCGLVAGTLLKSPWLGSVAFVMASGGWMLSQSNLRWTNALGIWLLFWLIVPLPMGIDTHLSQYLQGLSSSVSGLLLDLFRVANVVDGNTIILTTGRLFFEEACSGIVSLMAVVACSVIVAVVMNRSFPHLVLLTLAGVACATVMNVFRIIIIAFCSARFGIDLASGWPHELLGLVLFVGTSLLLLSMDRLLMFFLGPIRSSKAMLDRVWNRLFGLGAPVEIDPDAEPKTATGPHSNSWKRLTTSLCCVILGVFSAGYLFAMSPRKPSADEIHAIVTSLDESVLPRQIDGWVFVGSRNAHREAQQLFGDYSRIWDYRNEDGLTAKFSVDYLFASEWHELCDCYTSIGWQNTDRRVCRPIADERDSVRGIYRRETAIGTLHYSLANADGSDYGPPSAQSTWELTRRRLQKGSQRLMQLQLWITETESNGLLTAEDQQKLFEELRSRFLVAFRKARTGEAK